MVNLKAAVFDLDDTLIAEHDYIVSGFNCIAKIASKGDLNLQKSLISFLNDSLATGSRRDVLNRLVDQFPECRDLAVPDLVQAYRTHVPSIGFLPGMSALLEQLRTRGVRLGVISDGWTVSQRAKVNALDLASWVDVIVLTDEYGRDYWKPHERAFGAMEEALGFSAGELAYIADNPAKDFIAPNRRGWRTVKFLHDRSLYSAANPSTEDGAPTDQVASVEELSGLLFRWIDK